MLYFYTCSFSYVCSFFAVQILGQYWNCCLFYLRSFLVPQIFRGFTSEPFIQRVPTLLAFWDLEKTLLHEIRVSGTVLWSPTNANSTTYTYISQKPWQWEPWQWVGLYRTSLFGPEVRQISKVRTQQKPEVLLPGHRTFIT